MPVSLDKPLPDFSAPATGGVTFSPASQHGKIVVLYFYPKDNTPGCTTEAMNFRDQYDAFEAAGALHRLEAFASHFGADFYGLPRNTEHITLTRAPWQVPASYAFGEDTVVPMHAGETLAWTLQT